MRIFASPAQALHATQGLVVEGAPFVVEEVPARAEILLEALETSGLVSAALPRDFGLQPILAVHDADYLEYLQSAFSRYSQLYPKEQAVVPGTFAPRGARRKTRHIYGQAGFYAFGVGAPILAGTWSAAYHSAQCALTGAEALRQGERAAYALCRPPGHHASANQCGGFCYLNHAAIAARWLNLHENTRVAVLDIDYHHGNGTQEIFYRDPDVLFCSLHAHPDDDYPYFWGGADETGEGPGAGATRNWPLPPHTEDAPYLAALDEALRVIQAFNPGYLVISLGLDTLSGDPVGGFELTLAGLRQAATEIAALSLPTLMIQEGGYALDRLGEGIVAFVEPFATRNSP